MIGSSGGRGDTRRNLQLLLALRPILCADSDVDRTLENVALEIASSVADYCIVDMRVAGARSRRLVVAHADSSRLEDLRAAAERFVATPDGRVARGLVAKSAELVSHPRRKRNDDGDFEFLGEQTATSYVQAPLRARGEPFALITFVCTKAKPYDEGSLKLFEEVIAWCGLFVERALLRNVRGDTAEPSSRLMKRVRVGTKRS